MASLNHIHSYKRSKLDKNYYQCSHPECSHYIHKKLLCGKKAICPSCGEEFILSFESLRRSIPRCDKCSNTKRGMEARRASQIVENLLEEIEKKEEIPFLTEE